MMTRKQTKQGTKTIGMHNLCGYANDKQNGPKEWGKRSLYDALAKESEFNCECRVNDSLGIDSGCTVGKTSYLEGDSDYHQVTHSAHMCFA